MRIGVLGTGSVGRRIADKLVELGHEVTMGSRSADSEALREWLGGAGDGARGGTFFVYGDDEGAKATVRQLLSAFGWAEEQIVDLGDIAAARGTEMYLPLWLRLMGSLGTADFNIQVRIP
jgi:predicted dinucleotide-binding enzyme